MPNFNVYITLLYLVFYSIISCKEKTEKSTHKPILLATETVTPGNYGIHDTLDYQLTIFEDSTYSLSYKKTITDPDNIYGGEIHTDYKNGKAKIIKDSIFLKNDTLHLFNGYVEFIKNKKIDFVRKIDSTRLTYYSTYNTEKYPYYHIIYYETKTTEILKDKKEFKSFFEIDDAGLFEIEQLVKDSVDRIMPKTKIVGNDENIPFLTPKARKEFLKTPKGEPCCYYTSYYKKVLPYINDRGHRIVKLFLSLEASYILHADFPIVFDGGYYFVHIYIDLTNKKIIGIEHIGFA